MDGRYADVIGPSELMELARGAMGRAYVPYSNFPVGAAILFEGGRTVTGCNVENASYGLSICAERTAMVRAIAEGAGRPVAIAIAGRDDVSCPPCGACRQFLAEFAPEMDVILSSGGELKVMKLSSLLPETFVLER